MGRTGSEAINARSPHHRRHLHLLVRRGDVGGAVGAAVELALWPLEERPQFPDASGYAADRAGQAILAGFTLLRIGHCLGVINTLARISGKP